ncbi:MAG TPA: metallophosphoesterase [Candidatus Lokiarchaeia archaeon]|nr:metallophosphoesterase [Candidatus Lokiarchaeia archaeon]
MVDVIQLLKPYDIAIAVSDVHLGAIGNNRGQFLKFVQALNTMKELKYFLIAGDIFDMICQTGKKMAEKFEKSVIPAMRDLPAAVQIYVTLGNHEIPVTPPYETVGDAQLPAPAFGLDGPSFVERRDTVVDKLRTGGVDSQLLDRIQFCQYVLLAQQEGSWVATPATCLAENAEQLAAVEGKAILVCHGYQCEVATEEESHTWEDCLNVDDVHKDALDFIYNGVFENIIDLLDPKAWMAKLRARFVKSSVKQQAKDYREKHPEEYIHYIKARQHVGQKRNYKHTIDHTAQFLQNYNLTKLSCFLYGHTHNMTDSGSQLPGGPTRIINTGAWQQIPMLTCVGISDQGEPQVRQIRAPAFRWDRFIGLIVIVAIVVAIVVGALYSAKVL